MANYTTLTGLFKGIADAIRSKTGGSSNIVADNFPTAISGIITLSEGSSDATATASNIDSGKTAYVNGQKITGTSTKVDTSDATATAANILTGKTAWVKGSKVTGTMTDNGAKTSALNCGGSYTIPAGYHNGSGKITANTLASQTSANATAAQILNGQTAYVNGSKVTGTMTNQGAKTSSLNCGGSYTIPAGYHNGSGKITANTLASQTSATATAAQILSGQTAYVNGTKITGTMANQGAKTAELPCGSNFLIAQGYHNGNGRITTVSLAAQTQATATAADIATGKTAYVNGRRLIGTLVTDCVEGSTLQQYSVYQCSITVGTSTVSPTIAKGTTVQYCTSIKIVGRKAVAANDTASSFTFPSTIDSMSLLEASAALNGKYVLLTYQTTGTRAILVDSVTKSSSSYKLTGHYYTPDYTRLYYGYTTDANKFKSEVMGSGNLCRLNVST